MPLTPSTSRRALKHTRAIQIEAFVRDDGLWDLDAHIIDIKTRDAKLASGVRFQFDRCHTLRSSDAAVARYGLSAYPRWAVKLQAVSKSS